MSCKGKYLFQCRGVFIFFLIAYSPLDYFHTCLSGLQAEGFKRQRERKRGDKRKNSPPFVL